jgi:hypothetical protein
MFPEKQLDLITQNVNITISTLDVLDEISSSFIEVIASRDLLNKFSAFIGRNPKAGQWFHIDMPSKDGILVMQYTSLLDNDGTPRHMSSVDFLDGRTGTGRLLSQVISLDYFEDSDVDDIKDIFNNLMSPELIAVYNVGQGNCCALCNNRGVPLTYFDFGGGMGQHARTYPRSLTFCFTMNPPIILSHWDKDHWVSAEYNSESLNSKWIVPRQKLGVSHLKHAKNLFARNNLYIYPKTVPNIQLTIGMLIKDIGKSINDSGITLANEINVSYNNKFLTLFPGDCQYRFIPGIKTTSI